MASLAPTNPAPPAPDEFDPLEFWIRYKTGILRWGGLILAVAVAYLIYWRVQETTRANAADAYAHASTAEDFRKIADKYSETVIGGNALMMLAEKQRVEGKLDDSTATLRSFVAKYPKHPLISGGQTSLAGNLEAQGKLDEALAAYKNVVTSYGHSFSAAAAYLGQARILKAQGKSEEARHAYETLMTQFPESQFRQEALAEMARAKK